MDTLPSGYSIFPASEELPPLSDMTLLIRAPEGLEPSRTTCCSARTTRCSAPESPHPYSHPRVSCTCGFSVGIEVSGSHVPFNRLFGKLRPPFMPDAAPP